MQFEPQPQPLTGQRSMLEGIDIAAPKITDEQRSYIENLEQQSKPARTDVVVGGACKALLTR